MPGRFSQENTMHKSRLAGFIIDCHTDDLDQAARFWSEALGYPLKKSTSAEDTAYRLLDTPSDDLHIEVQKVEHPSRVHLDIESDDIEAEVIRLEKLGARRIARVNTWWVMEAPTGQRFCVVRQQRSDFASHANSWDG
jgi:catechol 2,3-dioxygenase-like lactoylglutathione lyase family enzyme